MINYIWGGMLIIGIIYGVVTKNTEQITSAFIDGSKEAVSLGISMAGIVSFWTGLMEVAEEAGIISNITKAILPFLRFLFPDIPKGHPAWNSIATNFVANLLGLGWAATPAGLRAMSDLKALECERGNPEYLTDETKTIKNRSASDEMCTFLVINISSLQLIPINIIAYRSQYGSASPASIIAPALICTFISSIVALIYCKGTVTINSQKK